VDQGIYRELFGLDCVGYTVGALSGDAIAGLCMNGYIVHGNVVSCLCRVLVAVVCPEMFLLAYNG
jgi:hypothetical protein